MQLVIESRRLTNEILADTFQGAVDPVVVFDDGGATLHVLGTDDGLEHLRFDCFEQEPHYHYIDQAASGNTVMRIDELAVGDPIEFSLGCVEHHLPDMLGNCNVPALADEVKGRMDEVLAAMPEVRALMLRRSNRSPKPGFGARALTQASGAKPALGQEESTPRSRIWRAWRPPMITNISSPRSERTPYIAPKIVVISAESSERPYSSQHSANG